MDGYNEQTIQNARPAPLKVGEPLPKLMGPSEMVRVFQISRAMFYRLQRAGEFRPFELPRRLSQRSKRYSGEKVQQFLNGRK